MIHYKFFKKFAGPDYLEYQLKHIKLTHKVSDAIFARYNEDIGVKKRIDNVLRVIDNIGNMVDHLFIQELIFINKQDHILDDSYMLFMVFHLSNVIKQSSHILMLLNNKEVDSWISNMSLIDRKNNKMVPFLDFFKSRILFIDHDGWFSSKENGLLFLENNNTSLTKNFKLEDDQVQEPLLKKIDDVEQQTKSLINTKESIELKVNSDHLYNSILYYTFVFYTLFSAPKWQSENRDSLVNIPMKKMYTDTEFYNSTLPQDFEEIHQEKNKKKKAKEVKSSSCSIL